MGHFKVHLKKLLTPGGQPWFVGGGGGEGVGWALLESTDQHYCMSWGSVESFRHVINIPQKNFLLREASALVILYVRQVSLSLSNDLTIRIKSCSFANEKLNLITLHFPYSGHSYQPAGQQSVQLFLPFACPKERRTNSRKIFPMHQSSPHSENSHVITYFAPVLAPFM